MYSPPGQGHQPPHFEHFPAFEHEPSVVQGPRGLHHGQVRHEHVCAGHGRGAQGERHCGQRFVAQNW